MRDTASLIVKIGRYILEKNSLAEARQRARSKANYYEILFKSHGLDPSDSTKHIRGFSKWNKPGLKGRLRLLMKRHRVEQMQIEVQIHELVLKFREEISGKKKELDYVLSGRDGKISSLIVYKDGQPFLFHREEIENLIVADDIEYIVLNRGARCNSRC